ncbi:MAG: lipopolysaccharide heptosyltransferase II [Desulfuromonadales bacterium]|nr:lipopolysaccharide heptosyltransferase II [Desulfuromonadales bacterium]
MNRIELLKKIDAVVGRLAVALLPPSPPVSRLSVCRRILVIRPGGIGDAVLLVPLLQQLQQRWPEARIDLLAERRNAAIFKLCPVVDRIHLYDKDGLCKVLRTRYDLVIDTEQWHRLSAVVARQVPARVRIGFGSNERRQLFTHAVAYTHQRYEVDSFLDLLRPLAIEPPDVLASPFLIVPAAERQRAGELLQLLAGRPFVALFPGASIAERRWGADRFGELAARLSNDGWPVVVIGGPDDRPGGDTIIAAADGLNLAGQTSLPGSAAIIARASLLISGDSGMLHVAVGLGRPTVALFGSGIAAKWAPRGGNHRLLNRELACSPCTRFGTTPPCPHGVRCLELITVEDVYQAAGNLLAAPGE